MFFEEDKNLDNLDDLELDFGEFEDKSITWDELLEDDEVDLVSIKKGDKAPLEDNEIILDDNELDLDVPEKDAFEVFGGDKDEINLEEDEVNVNIPQEKIDLSEEISPERGTREVLQNEPEESSGAATDEHNQGKPIQSESKNNKSAVLGVVAAICLVVTVGVFWFFTSKGADNDDFATLMNNNEQAHEQPVVAAIKNDLDQLGVSAPASEAQEAETPKEPVKEAAKPAADDKKVVVGIADAGRSNPFVPIGNINLAGFMTSPPVDIMMPPEEYGNLEEVQKLMGITVTGILYDSVKPSAIINVSGSDYFVQKGDKVDNYMVTQITPTNVTISSGKNTYKAGVGQPFDNGRIQGQTTLVQNRKFGGQTRHYTSTGDVEVNVRSQY